ncbi:membrane protein insertase YidC [Candidatus Dojkabacteria bacterium]|uniref:Membrane protein insertase YidC n=1 Tax=Candidatus Dojkabacteria bacterium TaxID=2099670 RepID=A0A955RIQ2_9BACT|nr:membrane protein insertase YidC [Candidatus Dojkabacteria bacterium]
MFNLIGSLVGTLVYEPVFNLLILLFNTTGNLGWSILLIAFLARLITFPLTQKQIKAAGKNKEFQKRMKDIRSKYKNDQEKLSREMAKIQAEFLPGQLGGCFNIIISILLLFQIRNVVIDLFNQGVHAFDKVSYSESLEFDEYSITTQLPAEFEYGVHDLKYDITAETGVSEEKIIKFAFAENEDDAKEFNKEIDSYYDDHKDELRGGDIRVYIPEFEDDYALVGRLDELTAFVNPPSNSGINYDDLKVYLDETEIDAESISYTVGEPIDLTFFGMDLSKVASDFDITDASVVAPYVVLSVTVGITQFFASRIQTGMNSPVEEEKKEKKKDADGKEEEPDFSELMAQSSQRMIYFFPIITVIMSLGYFGGAGLFPSGVSLFWTGQNTFVIIQQLVTNRDKVAEKLKKESDKNNTSNIPESSEENQLIDTAGSKKKKKKKKKKRIKNK